MSALAPPVGDTAPRASVAELRERFRSGKAALLTHFGESRATAPAASSLLRALARHVDQTLVDLWAHAGMPATAALLAVGGYGRGELFPYSDVDVLVLLPNGHDGADDAFRGTIEAFITACWDIGLEIGSSVRTVDECLLEARADVTVQTALLESRLLTGSRRMFNMFRRVNTEAMDARSFLRAKTFEMRQRQVKYEDTPYSLEPNCKESPGGLRDLQVLTWISRAAGLGRTWSEMAANGLLTAFEVKQLQRQEGTLKLIRARLHLIAGRREDRLVFDLQTAVAESFGYHGNTTMRASEMLMQRYYWAAKAVSQLNEVLLLNLEERINGSEDLPMQPLNERFLDRGGLLEVVSDDLYLRDPHAILETFHLYQTQLQLRGLSARTMRALYNVRNQMNGPFRKDPANRARFLAILQAPQRQTHAFRLMNATSVLGPLPVGVPPHRRAHAARPVPRLHGGPAHPDGAAQRAPLLHPRARSRVPEVHRARRELRQAVGALRGRAVPRRGQGPRRRPLRAGRQRGAPLLQGPRDHEGRRRLHRVPRAPPPDDEPHGAEGRPVRRQRHRRLRGQGRQPAPPDRAVPAHRGRHPRHQPQGVERVEGQAARGPVPPDDAQARRRRARDRCRDRGAQEGGAPDPRAAFRAARHRVAAVEDARPQLLRAHDPNELAWHARSLWRHLETDIPVVRARARRRSAKACRC